MTIEEIKAAIREWLEARNDYDALCGIAIPQDGDAAVQRLMAAEDRLEEIARS